MSLNPRAVVHRLMGLQFHPLRPYSSNPQRCVDAAGCDTGLSASEMIIVLVARFGCVICAALGDCVLGGSLKQEGCLDVL